MEILLIFHVIVIIALVMVILVQRTSNDGLMSGGGSNAMMSGRSRGNMLSRTTAILATIFIINSLVLSWLASHSRSQGGLTDKLVAAGGELSDVIEPGIIDETDTAAESSEDNTGVEDAIDGEVIKDKNAEKKTPAAIDKPANNEAPEVPVAE